MSSSHGEGITHKVYGVTSEGVAVFLEEVRLLVKIGLYSGLQPSDPTIRSQTLTKS